MKLLFVFFSIICALTVKAQEGHAHLMIYGKPQLLTHKYAIDIRGYSRALPDSADNRPFVPVIFNPDNTDHIEASLSRDNIQCVTIREKGSHRTMQIFIRFCGELWHGGRADINKLVFGEGLFFYDCCGKDNDFRWAGHDELSDFKKHKIDFRRMRLLLSENHCPFP